MTRPDNYHELKKERPLRCAVTNTSVFFAKADYEGQDIDIKEDEVECKVTLPKNTTPKANSLQDILAQVDFFHLSGPSVFDKLL